MKSGALFPGGIDALAALRLDIERDGRAGRQILATILASLAAQVQFASDNLQRDGLLTTKGRVRALSDVFDRKVDRIVAVAKLLGVPAASARGEWAETNPNT